MILLAVDPGNHTGWARFNYFHQGDRASMPSDFDSELEACGWVASVDLADLEVYGDRLIVEIPQIYPRSPVDPNDLIQVALVAGEVIRMAKDSRMSVRTVRPREWKGNVKKAIHHPRVRAALTADELKLLGKAPRHDVLDAVGLGLWELGRMGK